MTAQVDHFALRTLLVFLEKECRVPATRLATTAKLGYEDYKNYRNFRSGSAAAADKKFAAVLSSIKDLCIANLPRMETSPVALHAYRQLYSTPSNALDSPFIFDPQMADLSHPSLVERFLQLYSGLWWILRPGSGLDSENRPKTFNLSMMTVSPTILPGHRAPRVKYYYRHGNAPVGLENTYEAFVCSAAVQLQWVEVVGVREFGTDILRVCWPFWKMVVGQNRVRTFYGLGQMHNSDLKPVASRMWFVFDTGAETHEELEKLKDKRRSEVRLGSYSGAELEKQSTATDGKLDFLATHRTQLRPILLGLGTVIDAYRINTDDAR